MEKSEKENSDIMIEALASIMLIVFWICWVLYLNIKAEYIENEVINNHENIEFYIDNHKVEYNTIDIDDYYVSYNKDSKEVILTKKKGLKYNE